MKKTISLASMFAILTSLFLIIGCGATEEAENPQASEINDLQAKYAPAMINVKITEEDLAQGWYYGDISEKKADTPDDWLWTKDEEKPESSKWMKPPVEEMLDF